MRVVLLSLITLVASAAAVAQLVDARSSSPTAEQQAPPDSSLGSGAGPAPHAYLRGASPVAAPPPVVPEWIVAAEPTDLDVLVMALETEMAATQDLARALKQVAWTQDVVISFCQVVRDCVVITLLVLILVLLHVDQLDHRAQ